MWLTLLALRNRIGILMLSLAMVILGATSVQRLPVDLFPQIQVPVAFVGVIYKGAPPLDIEQSVVYPIEKAVSSASNVEHVESFAKQGIGAVQTLAVVSILMTSSEAGGAAAERRLLERLGVETDADVRAFERAGVTGLREVSIGEDGTVKVEEQGKADAILKTDLLAYEQEGLRYDDLEEVHWFSINELPEMKLDGSELVNKAYKEMCL